jgi:hypothetical protein
MTTTMIYSLLSLPTRARAAEHTRAVISTFPSFSTFLSRSYLFEAIRMVVRTIRRQGRGVSHIEDRLVNKEEESARR